MADPSATMEVGSDGRPLLAESLAARTPWAPTFSAASCSSSRRSLGSPSPSSSSCTSCPAGRSSAQIMRLRMASMTEGGSAAPIGRGRCRAARRGDRTNSPVLRVRQAGSHPLRAVAVECAASRPGQLVRLSGARLGRHQLAVSCLHLPRPHRLPAELSRLRAAGRPQGREARQPLRLRQQRRWCSSGTPCPAGRSARRCWCSSAAAASGACSRWEASARTTGSICRSARRSPTRRGTCSCRSFCYMIGGFATLTILTKNSLMENMSQDYVRTAFAKGLHKRRVIFVHALRNSLIPIATGLGHVFSLILAGSFLIEKVFNIDGMGYLGYNVDPPARLPGCARHPGDRQPVDAGRQHSLRRHLRVRRSAHPVQMTAAARSESHLPQARPQVPAHQARLLLVSAHRRPRTFSRSSCRSS